MGSRGSRGSRITRVSNELYDVVKALSVELGLDFVDASRVAARILKGSKVREVEEKRLRLI